MKNTVIFLTFLIANFTIAQIGMGEWRLHIPSNDAVNVADGGSSIHVSYNNAVLSYDIETGEITRRDKVNYLSEIEVSTIGFDEASSQLFIGYETGNIDVLKDEKITNLPYIVNASITGDKSIYSIKSYENFIYLSTGFGVVVIDPVSLEVSDTYYPTGGFDPVIDINFFNDSIYALTESKLFKGKVDNPFLADPNQWVEDSRLLDYSGQGVYKQIIDFQNEQYVSYNDQAYGQDSIFKLNDGSNILSGYELYGLSTTNEKLMIGIDGGLLVYDETLTQIDNFYQNPSGEFPAVYDAVFKDGVYYYADNRAGFLKASNPFNVEVLGFDGPYNKLAYRIAWGDGKLGVAGGQLSGKNPAFQRHGGYTFENEEWVNFNPINQEKLNPPGFWDMVSVAVDPKNSDRVAFGSYSEIPLILIEDGTTVADTFTPNNSYLEWTSLGNNWSYVTDVSFDNDGNLWVLNALSSKPLKVYTKDGLWYEFNLPSSASNQYMSDLTIDYNGVKWFNVVGIGVIAFDEGEDFEDLSDDQFKVFGTGANSGDLPSNNATAITVDFDNEIWVGTPAGLRVLYNTSNIFDAAPGEYNFQKILKQFEENTEEVLKNVSIVDIEVDGANRKWIATESSGVFLFSANGLELIREFTKENSPLVSNDIEDIAIDQNTGEVYFATLNGLVSYRGDATYGDNNYENVIVFPNPVKPDYHGPISMQGIAFNSAVRITDVSGNLVYSTVSNGGTVTWDGNTLQGERAKTGVYLIWTAPAEGKGRKVGKVVFIN